MNRVKMMNNTTTCFLWTITTFLITFSTTFAQTQRRTDPNEEIIEFKRLEIKDINQMLNPLTGKKIVPTKEAESLRIVFYSEQSLPKSKVIKLVYKYLKECDFMAEENKDAIYIKPNITNSKADIPLVTNNTKLSELDKDLVVRKVFQLKYVRPSEICQLIGSMLSDSGYSSIDDEEARTMLVIDKVLYIPFIGKQISELDTETSDLPPDPMVAFGISDETIGNLIPALISWTGKSVILSREAINSRISIAAPRIIRRSQAISAIYAAIKAQDFIVEETCDLIYIKSRIIEPTGATTLLTDDVNLSGLNKDLIVQKKYKFKYYSLSQMAQIIEPLLSDNGYLDDQDGFLLVVTDKVSVLLQIDKIINILDKELKPDTRHKIFEVHKRDPIEMAELLQAILKNKTGIGSSSQQDSNQITLIPVPEKKWIIARAPAEAMELISDWIAKLDNGNPPDKMLEISLSDIQDKNQVVEKFFYLKYSSPEHMAQILKPLLSKDGYLKAEENTRTLLIVETTENLIRLEMIIKSFDAVHPPNSQHIFTLKYIDPNKAAEVITKVIKLKIFRLSEETVIIPVPEKNWLIVQNEETPEEAKFIMDLLENIDFQKNPEGVNDIKAFKLTNRSLIQLEQIIKPLIGKNGHVNADEQTQTLEIIDTVENLTHIEKLIKILDTSGIRIEDPMVFISLSSIDINGITKIITDWTGKKVIPSKEAQNLTIMLYTPKKMHRSEALNMLYTVMREMGFVKEETDDKIYFKPIPNKPDGVPLLGPDESLEKIQDKDMIVRKVFKLNYCSLSDMGKILLPLMNSYGHLTADESSKTMMITDSVGTLMKIEPIIKQFDINDASWDKSGIFEVKVQDPNELARLIQLILKQQKDANSPSHATSGRTSSRARAHADANSIQTNIVGIEAEKQGYETIQVKDINAVEAAKKLNEILTQMGIDTIKSISIQPLVQSKQILVFGNETDKKLAKSLILDLDAQARDKSIEFERVPVIYVDANELAVSLNQIFNDLTPYDFHRASIYPIIPSNQILIFGKEEFRNLIKILVKEIDLPPKSFIEKEIFQLKFADTKKIVSQLKGLFSCEEMIFLEDSRITSTNKPLSNNTVFFAEEPSLRQLIVISSFRNINKIRGLISQWDKQNTDLSKNEDYEVIQVAHIDVNKASDVLSKIALRLETKNIFIQPLIENNLLLLFGDNNLIQTLKKQLKKIDTESFKKAQNYDIIPIYSTDVNEVADALHIILEDIYADYKNKITIVPISDLHLILIFGDKDYCESIKKITKEPPPMENALQRKTFKLKYAKAEELQVKIDELFNSTTSTTTTRTRTSSGSTPEVKFTADTVITTIYPSLNQIVVLASEENMKIIEKMILEWDSPFAFEEMKKTDFGELSRAEPNEQK